MDEQLKKMLLDAAQKGINGVENTINWVLEQAPDLLEQLVLYNLVTGLVWSTIGIVGTIVSISYIKKFVTLGKEDDWDDGSNHAGTCFSCLGAIISFTIFACNIGDTIKCAFAPKLFIFEYLSKLIQ